MSGLWALRYQRQNRLLVVHPSRSRWTAPSDHIVDALVIADDIAREDGLVMRDPIAQCADDAQIGVSRGPALCDRLSCGGSGKIGAEMRIPDATILAGGEYPLPEGKFKFGYDLTRRWKPRGTRRQIGCWIVVCPSFGAWKAPDKAIVSRPVHSMDGFDCFGDAVAYRNLADL